MRIRIGLEKGIEGRNLGWALDYPGCFAYGADDAEVALRMPQALMTFDYWLRDHADADGEPMPNDLDFRIVEIFECYKINENYEPSPSGDEINAWFHDDWRPLTALEAGNALNVFNWQRDELLAGMTTLPTDLLDKPFENERWTINGICAHIANAELWYLDRLGLAPLRHAELPQNPLARCDVTAGLINAAFTSFPEMVKVVGVAGEFWSPRKIIRRTLWHQRDHIDHIKKLAFSSQDA